MSFTTNHKLWVTTKKDMEDVIKRQNVLKKREPIDDPVITFKMFSQMYVLYVDLVQKLGQLYQHTVQVQKRDVIRDLLNSTTARLIELKKELKNIEMNEYVYADDVLIERRLTPYDVYIWRSPHFLFRRPPEIQNLLCDNLIFESEEDKEERAAREKQKIIEAVILIQIHERARQARVYYSNVLYDRKYLETNDSTQFQYTFIHKPDQQMSLPIKRTIFNANYYKSTAYCEELLKDYVVDTNEVDADEDSYELELLQEIAAIKIQKAWRIYWARKILRHRIEQKEELYGMTKVRRFVNPNKRTEDMLETYHNELVKRKLDQDFVDLMASERTRLLQERTPQIMEDVTDHIRGWFREFYDKFGTFHPYPDIIKGGTVLVIMGNTMDIEEYRQFLEYQNLSKEEKKKRQEKLKQQRDKEKEKLKKDKMKLAKRRKKMKEAGVYDIGYDIANNRNIKTIETIMEQYSTDWRYIDEYLNKNHEAIKEWATEDQLAIIHKELRVLVDEYMILEYEILRKALATDMKKKYKPQKQKKPKEKKAKKGKKKPKDMTEDRTIESLYEELVEEGVVVKLPEKTFDMYVGDFNYVADNTRDVNKLTVMGPAKAELRYVLEECMLGMGAPDVEKSKSLCIVGPLRSGKRLLVNIIASELDALVLNISPEVTVKYADNMKYFLHVIMKVAKAFQPTILYIENAHRVFWRKVPKEMMELMPKLLQKLLPKQILKAIKNTDRIMVVGTTDEPWAASNKLVKTFQKIVLVPPPDYGSSFLLWLDELTKTLEPSQVKDYMLSALAKVFGEYISGDIVENVENTLDITRVMRLNIEPLDPKELAEYFLDRPDPILPLDEKTMEKYNKWYLKANKYSKQKAKYLAMLASKQQKKK